MWVQTVAPNAEVKDYAGMCLRFAQSVFNAPVRYASAWDAWVAIPDKQLDRNIPDAVGVLVWFSHYGTYSGKYANWGHVVAHMPDNRYLSSPANGYGQDWLNSIEEVEKRFNATYVGWSPSINGLTVATQSTPPPPPMEEEEMKILSVAGAAYLVGKGYCARFIDHTAYAINSELYGKALQLANLDDWNRCTWVLGIPVGVREELDKRGGWAIWEEGIGYYDGSIRA